MSTNTPHIAPVPLDKAYRLLNHGPVVLVSAAHAGQHNVMAASWACALDFAPPKVTVVLDKATRTRELVEASGWFALQLPTVPLAALTVALGTDSAKTVPDKLQRHGVPLFEAPGHPADSAPRWCKAAPPGCCAAWSPSRTTSSPTTFSSAKWWPPGPTTVCSATGTGSSTARRMTCARCTTWRVGSFMRRGRRCGCEDRRIPPFPDPAVGRQPVGTAQNGARLQKLVPCLGRTLVRVNCFNAPPLPSHNRHR